MLPRAAPCSRVTRHAPMKASSSSSPPSRKRPPTPRSLSHQLMMRAGMIKRLGAGIYSYMPMGLRVIRKVEAIVREEMNRAGAVELLMPVVQPAELWQETGRFQAWARAAARQGPPRARLRHPADQRRGHHRHRAPGTAQLQAAAEEFLPHPDQVPRRAPAALRRDARPRVHDEGRVLLRPRCRRGQAQLRGDGRSLLRASSTASACATARSRPTAAPSAATCRRSSRSSPTPARTRSSIARTATTPPTWKRPRRWRRRRRAPPPRSRMAKTPTPGKSTCEDVADLLGVPLATTVKSLVLATDALGADGRRRRDLDLAAAAARRPRLNEIKASKVPG